MKVTVTSVSQPANGNLCRRWREVPPAVGPSCSIATLPARNKGMPGQLRESDKHGKPATTCSIQTVRTRLDFGLWMMPDFPMKLAVIEAK